MRTTNALASRSRQVGCPAVPQADQFTSMKVISVLAQKGGTGKTTLSVATACAAAADGLSTVIVDLDPGFRLELGRPQILGPPGGSARPATAAAPCARRGRRRRRRACRCRHRSAGGAEPSRRRGQPIWWSSRAAPPSTTWRRSSPPSTWFAPLPPGSGPFASSMGCRRAARGKARHVPPSPMSASKSVRCPWACPRRGRSPAGVSGLRPATALPRSVPPAGEGAVRPPRGKR